ncbi:hypothetical protein DESAMIL20_1636 [Desulfurella amilsii]|uniref:Uncharacterized protein n=1 Tax=Desulfurella amilsii TaxID=1562698 RepID=A0A1X4XX24_9BACT|nr:hypothetical protein [Desulfurella amilsii]OSS42083.1 hypothetical protein DESAMIL20_1636 [Desulfurella amilsii]
MSARKIFILILVLLLVLIGYKIYTHLSYQYKVKKALELLKNQPVIDIYSPVKPIVVRKI